MSATTRATSSRARAAAGLLALAAACAGVPRYPNEGARNVHVVTKLESGVSAELQVYAVDGSCAASTLGRLALDRGAVDVAVATGRPALLVVTFDTSSFLRGSRRMSTEVLVTPRAGTAYELTARYADEMYDVALREVGPRGKRELPHRGLDACRAN